MAKLSSICSRVCSGGTPKSAESSFYGGGIPWLNTKEIDFNVIESTEKTITQAGLDNSSAKWVDAPSVIVAMYGATAGKVAISKIRMTTNQACCNLNIDPVKADYRFVYYALKNDYTRLSSMANGGAQQNLNSQQIKDFEIPDYSYSEQKKIASILSSLDEKIETNRKINARLEELAQAIFKSWFIDNAVYENSTIADFFLPNRGKSLLTSDAKLGEVPVVAGGLTPATYHNKSNTKAPVITISASGANAGFVNIWGCPVWSSDSSFIDNSITPYVYFWYSLLKYYQKIIYHSQTGCAQPHIYPKHIGNINIPCIEDRKMEIFEKVVTPLFEKLFENKKESARLAALRDTLLPKLMSGELIPE